MIPTLLCIGALAAWAWGMILERRHGTESGYADIWWVIANIQNVAFWQIEHEPVGVAVFGVLLAFTIWWWWQNRHNRRRRKALDALGAKSRALRDALVRKAREAAKPKPVFKPAPGGVHA